LKEKGCSTLKMHRDGENCPRRSMSETTVLPEHPDQPERYEIRLKGHLNHRWTVWFEGMTIALEANGDTLLIGPVIDQAALHGLLRKVRDIGMPLVSVNRVEPGPADAAQPAASGVKSSTGVGGLFTPD
jgi:hypothetical protein